MRNLRFPVVLLPSLMLVLASCAATTPTPAASEAGGGASIAVTLQEWAVVPAQSSAPAGEVTFTITNEGPDDVHEFVVMKTDLDPADLPTLEDGSVDEAGEGIEEVAGEIEDIAVGSTMDLTLTLEAGNYVLLCNIYTADEDEAHYEMGMRTAFTME
jgi:uncharacterized cupredoxin-like copper-binding protein